MLRPAAVLYCILAAPGAMAGAWPREGGTAFLSLSGLFSASSTDILAPDLGLTSYSTAFAEYGLTDMWTIGADIAYGQGSDEALYTGLVFLRRPFWRGERDIFAAELGLGAQAETDDAPQARLRPGLSWGRGYEIAWGQGWMGIESSLEWRLPSNELVVKADATLGLRPSENWMLIGQLQTGHYPGSGLIVKFAPSIVRQIGERSHLQLGLSLGLAGDEGVGVKVATWFSF
ncbi:MAG TPA: hypothetical protein VFR34_00125 [Paracoccaceae bacterium]|nr:hypothetical protein [Paracoccaceae bacterium]